MRSIIAALLHDGSPRGCGRVKRTAIVLVVIELVEEGFMLITLPADSDRPLYVQLADAFRQKIIHGEISTGDTLPTARVLGRALDINVHTVLRAYQQLRDEGLVDLKRGRGAVVTGLAERISDLEHGIETLMREANELGISPKMLAAMIDSVSERRETHD